MSIGSESEPRRVALVTGAGRRRVGSYVAEALAARGYAVALHYHSAKAEAEESASELAARGAPAVALPADLRDEASARALVEAVAARFRRLDVLVNCASVWPRKSFEEVTAGDVRTSFEVNVLATFVCSQQAGLLMVRQPEGGSIVNFGDWAEARPYPDYAAYFATKGSIPALTRCLAVELGMRNPRVRVNCILPGPVLFAPELPEAERRQSVARTLTKQADRPEWVADAVLFLVGNEFVTGSCLTVDGGRTVYATGD